MVNNTQDKMLYNQELLSRLEQCTNLPTPPAVAMQIIDLAKDPEVDIGKVADVICKDPALTAKILRVTNSPMYALRRKTDNLRQAIMLLGLNGTLSLALTFALASAMSNDSKPGFDYELFWRRSLASAICSRRLGLAIGLDNGEELFLAALLQDIGMLVLDKLDPEFYPGLGVDQSDHKALQVSEREQLGADHAAIGGWILEKWGVPECLQSGVLDSHRPAEVMSGDDYSRYHQCVSVSGLLVDALLKCHDERTLLATASIAVQRLGVEQNKLSEILQMLNTDMQEASSLFSTDLYGYQLEQALLEQAQETLIMRNLKIIQQTDDLQKTTEELEARTRDLEEMNRRDGLTDLYNREFLDNAIRKEFDMAQSHGWSLAVMFVDLDHFKVVNDTYGHQAGDKVLENTAELLTSATRSDDLVARYGGEEFVILLPGTNRESSIVVAERLMNMFRDYSHKVNVDEEITVTASIGIAIMGNNSQFAGADDLVAAADKALYAAKVKGRNCFVVYGDTHEAEEDLLPDKASAG